MSLFSCLSDGRVSLWSEEDLKGSRGSQNLHMTLNKDIKDFKAFFLRFKTYKEVISNIRLITQCTKQYKKQ
jgi:hypothetical protein